MRIALIGATGFIGSAVLREALARGHQVTGIVRHPEKLPEHRNLVARKGDVMVEPASLVAGHNAVISAFSADRGPEQYDQHIAGYRKIIDGVKQAGVNRLLVVGGAGSLEVAPGVQVVDDPEFPEEWKPSSLATREVLYLLRDEQELDWTYLSPSGAIAPGERTGKFRLGTDQLLTDANGESRISLEDYAVAMLDELEDPKHIRRRFTAGY